jgi:hypothetical protein
MMGPRPALEQRLLRQPSMTAIDRTSSPMATIAHDQASKLRQPLTSVEGPRNRMDEL